MHCGALLLLPEQKACTEHPCPRHTPIYIFLLILCYLSITNAIYEPCHMSTLWPTGHNGMNGTASAAPEPSTSEQQAPSHQCESPGHPRYAPRAHPESPRRPRHAPHHTPAASPRKGPHLRPGTSPHAALDSPRRSGDASNVGNATGGAPPNSTFGQYLWAELNPGTAAPPTVVRQGLAERQRVYVPYSSHLLMREKPLYS